MAAGTKYNLKSEYKPEEIYRVESGVRKSGAWKLITDNLPIGEILPVFAPLQADLKTRKVTLVRNIKVYAKYVNETDGTSMKIAKGSFAYVGMFIGNGTNGAQISKIDNSKKEYDLITLKAAFGKDVEAESILFEATAVEGTTKKNTANFVSFDEIKIDEFGTCPTLLMQAYEVKEPKLPLPIHELDKVGLTSRFQFEY